MFGVLFFFMKPTFSGFGLVTVLTADLSQMSLAAGLLRLLLDGVTSETHKADTKTEI